MKGTQDDLLRILSPKQAEYLLHDFPVWAHEPQLPPAGTWRTWLLMGGRGAGKTRAGAEWLNALASKNRLDHSGLHFHGDSGGRVALIGETFQDARAVMIEGESGILATSRKDRRPVWHPSRKQLEWPNGTIGQVFSATDPDGLRGSQFGAAWCDVIAVAAALASAMGISIDGPTQSELADIIVQFAAAGGALLAIYGRLSATHIIT